LHVKSCNIGNPWVPSNSAEPKGPESKPCVPFVFVADGDDAQEQEDDHVRERAHGLNGVLHRRVSLLRDVRKGISLLSDTACYLHPKE